MKVLSKKQIFGQYESCVVQEGLTLSEILLELDYKKEVWDYTKIRVNGYEIYRNFWERSKLKEGQVLTVAIVPAGGGNQDLIKTAAIIAVSVVVPGAQTFGSPYVAALFKAGAVMVASLALNSMFPPPKPDEEEERTAINSITGQSNRADPNGVCIRNYGFNKVYPRVAAQPFNYFIGTTNYLVAIYDFGIGKQIIQEKELKIGETPITQFQDIEYFLTNDPSDFKIYTQRVETEDFNVLFENPGDNSIRTTPDAVESFEILLSHPTGLIGQNPSGRTFELTQRLEIKVRPTGSFTWANINAYDVDMDKELSLETKRYFNIGVEPHFSNVTSSVSGGGGPSNISFTTTTRELGFNSNTIVYRNYFGSPVDLESGILSVGDRLYIGSQFLFVVEVLAGPEAGYESVRLNRPIDFTTTIISSINSISPDYIPDDGARDASLRVTVLTFKPTINLIKKTSNPFFTSIKVNPNLGPMQWDVWVVYEDLEGESVFTFDDFSWYGLRGYIQDKPILSNVEHTYLEVKIKATDQLTGNLDTVNALCYSELDYYNNTTMTWSKKTTNNPAWVFVDILTGDVNQRAISKDRLDLPSITAWAEYCETNLLTYQSYTYGFECNFVLDYSSTIKNIIAQVCSCGRATLNLINGKYGVIIDEFRITPVQIFNQRNIKSINTQRDYTPTPDAVRCLFVDPESNWQKNEVIAYNDGFSELNAEIIEDIEVFGTTNIPQAWRQGRYFLAQKKLRQDNATLEVDFESMACSRGDLVILTHDSLKDGALPARVTNVSSDLITLDENVVDNGDTYYLRARIRSTDTVSDLLITEFVDVNIVRVDDPLALQWDDLVVFGELVSIDRKFLAKSITPSDDLNATIALTEYNEDIYTADTETIPDYIIHGIGDPLSGNAAPSPVINLSEVYNIDCHQSEKRYVYNVDLTWERPETGTVENYEIYLEVGNQTQLIGFTQDTTFNHEISGIKLDIDHTYTVVAVNGQGGKLTIGESSSLTFTPVDDTTRPEDVPEFNANILTETIELEWNAVTDCDIDRYYIRYSPLTSGANWAQSTRITSASSNQNNIQVPLRTGTYFIKAQDWAGNRSLTANFLKTHVPLVTDLEFIDEIDLPPWDGVAENTQFIGDGLLIDSADGNTTFVTNQANFYISEIFDLGDIFTARFTSSVIAEGFSKSSLMSEWLTLASIDPIAGDFDDDDFNAATYIRTRNAAETMSDWLTLSDVDFISFGSELTATPWQRFTQADFTGQLFQLKVQLDGNLDLDVSPLVSSANITANWTPRIEDGDDVASGDQVTFDFEFVEIPTIQVTTQENISTGDYFLFTNKSVSGFEVQFYDSGDNPISSPKYDWIAKGFGRKYTLDDINF